MKKNIKIAIMQPYFFPYIGYFQLINSVDEFVIYDNIQYTKKGFINRNRILCNGKDKIITLPIKKDSDYLDVVERNLSDSWEKEKRKMLNIIISSYKKAPFFNTVYPLLEEGISGDEKNLFRFIHTNLSIICEFLNINTKIIISSTLDIDHSLRGEEKVIEVCRHRKAHNYINAIGGIKLYSKDEFRKNNIELNFIKSEPIEYNQFGKNFIPWLSIIDIMMFNSPDTITDYLNKYTLI